MMEYKKKLIKLGKTSKAVVLPINFLKSCSDEEIIIEEYPNKLIIKFAKAGGKKNGMETNSTQHLET